ncbi:MAG: hypothetical protein K2G01_02420, partial [Paramuribaculum sp.]|nr:hypothetical protein [Paramuribaculum sp.]
GLDSSFGKPVFSYKSGQVFVVIHRAGRCFMMLTAAKKACQGKFLGSLSVISKRDKSLPFQQN